jgi:hypothetical protein
MIRASSHEPQTRRRVGSTPPNERELLLFRRWFAMVQARQEELQEETFTESAPPMLSRFIWTVKEPLTD